LSTSSEFIIDSSKQEGGATVLGGGDIILGRVGTCDHFSLNVNILGKTAVLHFALTPFCSWGCVKHSLQII
jgi:hypothetical protein